MFITLVPLHVAPVYSNITSVFVYKPYFAVSGCMYSYDTRMLLVCTRVMFWSRSIYPGLLKINTVTFLSAAAANIVHNFSLCSDVNIQY